MLAPRVAVFACNEERHIARCLDSLHRATSAPEELRVRVLVNGCRDRTEDIIRAYAAACPNVEPVVLPIGGKANAWNYYVYDGIDPQRNHYFVDGDTWLPPLALDMLEKRFNASSALGLAPLPIGVSDDLRQMLMHYRLNCGATYAVRGTLLARLVERGIRMPTGMIGDDNFAASLLKSNLSEHFDDWDDERILMVEDIGPVISRSETLSLAALRLQFQRAFRYGRREMQMDLVNHFVQRYGLSRLPAEMRRIEKHWQALGWSWALRWRGAATPFRTWAAIKMILAR